jgi:hypothetical protein
MTYFANFGLESVKVKYTSDEDGEYTFQLSYANEVYDTINTPQDVADGSVWPNVGIPGLIKLALTSELEDNEKFNLVFESREYDDGFRFGDDIGRVEKSFGISDAGSHTIPLTDDGGNEIEFRISISIIKVPRPKDTVPSLRGIRVYEYQKYNASLVVPGLIQNFGVGYYDLPYEPEFLVGGRFPFPVRVIGIQPDSISSLKIGSSYYVKLYDQIGQKGNMIEILENTPIMPDGWNDRVKSIEVGEIVIAN